MFGDDDVENRRRQSTGDNGGDSDGENLRSGSPPFSTMAFGCVLVAVGCVLVLVVVLDNQPATMVGLATAKICAAVPPFLDNGVRLCPCCSYRCS